MGMYELKHACAYIILRCLYRLHVRVHYMVLAAKDKGKAPAVTLKGRKKLKKTPKEDEKDANDEENVGEEEEPQEAEPEKPKRGNKSRASEVFVFQRW